MKILISIRLSRIAPRESEEPAVRRALGKSSFLCFPPTTHNDEGFISTARAINSPSREMSRFSRFHAVYTFLELAKIGPIIGNIKTQGGQQWQTQ